MQQSILRQFNSATPGIPARGFRATRYSDWTDGALCRLPSTSAPIRMLPAEAHAAVVASAAMEVALASAPRWTIVDVGQLGAGAYTAPVASAAPLYDAWQAAVLSAVRMLRRWQWYAEALPDAASANMPLDGCRCHHCLGGAGRAIWQSANAPRIRRENAYLAARAKTRSRQRRFEAAVEAALDAASDAHQVAASVPLADASALPRTAPAPP